MGGFADSIGARPIYAQTQSHRCSHCSPALPSTNRDAAAVSPELALPRRRQQSTVKNWEACVYGYKQALISFIWRLLSCLYKKR